MVQIPAEGTYDITTDGKVNGYINPQLAFGHGSSYGWLVWVFAGLFVLGLLELTASILWAVRSRRPSPAPFHQPIHVGDTYPVGDRRATYARPRTGSGSSSSKTWPHFATPARSPRTSSRPRSAGSSTPSGPFFPREGACLYADTPLIDGTLRTLALR